MSACFRRSFHDFILTVCAWARTGILTRVLFALNAVVLAFLVIFVVFHLATFYHLVAPAIVEVSFYLVCLTATLVTGSCQT